MPVRRWQVILLTVAGLLAPACAIAGSDQSKTPFQVITVTDGDTIWVCCLNGQREKVRYIGIDAPETQHPIKGVQEYGHEAKAANRSLVEGKMVRLAFDVARRDRYDRLLAYVYMEDGTFVNAWLVREGFAQVMTVPPNVKYQELFLKLQREAREAGRGLWGR